MIDISISEEHLDKLYSEIGYTFSENACVLSEELSELNKELMKLCRHRHSATTYTQILDAIQEYKPHVIEEMAHVYICMEAIKKILYIDDMDIQKEIDEKEHK